MTVVQIIYKAIILNLIWSIFIKNKNGSIWLSCQFSPLLAFLKEGFVFNFLIEINNMVVENYQKNYTFILMKEILKKIPLLTHVVHTIRKFRGITSHDLKIDYFAKKRDADIQLYLNSEAQKKLQIGCQDHPMKGWLNADINPLHEEIILMDATKPFPLPNDTFEFIFSEHMIEHIGFQEGLAMMKECYRVMKTGGVIRLSTPNIKFLIELYNEPKSETQKKYLDFSKRYFSDNRPILDTIIINNFFRDWGHQFIHDFKTLEYILAQAGFKNVKQCEVYKSEYAVLQNLEKHALELGEEFNQLESIVVEAEKI